MKNRKFFDSARLERAAAKWRKPLSVFIALVCVAILLLTGRSWAPGGAIDCSMELVGLAFVTLGVGGRIWSAFYLCGHKNDRLVDEGPYSLCRNPLYLFSLFGAIGVGLASLNLLALAVIIVTFAIYYPLVIRAEERHLREKLGASYADYTRRTPRFFPTRFQPREPDTYLAKPRQFRLALLDTGWFFAILIIVRIMARAHEAGWLPTWFVIP